MWKSICLLVAALLVSLASFSEADPATPSPAEDGPEVIDTGSTEGTLSTSQPTEGGATGKKNVTDEKPEEYWIWERRWIQEYDRRCMEQRPCPRPRPCGPCVCQPCPTEKPGTDADSAKIAYQRFLFFAERCARQNLDLNNVVYWRLRLCTEDAIKKANTQTTTVTTKRPNTWRKNTNYYAAYRRGH